MTPPTVKLLRPLPPPTMPAPPVVACSHVAQAPTEHLRAWRLHRYGAGAGTCQRAARVEIDGKPLCTLHAGQVALRALLEQQGAT